MQHNDDGQVNPADADRRKIEQMLADLRSSGGRLVFESPAKPADLGLLIDGVEHPSEYGAQLLTAINRTQRRLNRKHPECPESKGIHRYDGEEGVNSVLLRFKIGSLMVWNPHVVKGEPVVEAAILFATDWYALLRQQGVRVEYTVGYSPAADRSAKLVYRIRSISAQEQDPQGT